MSLTILTSNVAILLRTAGPQDTHIQEYNIQLLDFLHFFHSIANRHVTSWRLFFWAAQPKLSQEKTAISATSSGALYFIRCATFVARDSMSCSRLSISKYSKPPMLNCRWKHSRIFSTYHWNGTWRRRWVRSSGQLIEASRPRIRWWSMWFCFYSQPFAKASQWW